MSSTGQQGDMPPSSSSVLNSFDLLRIGTFEKQERKRSMDLESMEMDENEISSVIHGEDCKSNFVVKVFEQVTITQANQNLSIECDDVEVTAIKDLDDLPGPRETKESTIQERTMSVERIEQGINHHLSLCSELNEVEEEKAPETPVYIEGLNQLQRKLLKSLDESVVSEIEGGEGVLTIERLKSALKAKRKALGLYIRN
ncbi:hypothetical protein HHK36_021141 [Tetracentron sinense]|uniref:Uncharacterized protein n=1 Tax=Tetracentron sinense TaxID=13715 RepID=A0A834YWD6_TETSI|nr:hypothetical protein HHK36_021141 [Tetracentron sinense]